MYYLYHKIVNLSSVFGNFNNVFAIDTEISKFRRLAFFTIRLSAFFHFYYLYEGMCVKI